MSRTQAPVPSSADAHLAAAAIWDRHHRADDPDLGRLDPSDLPGVLDYVTRYYRNVRPSIRSADALDALLIVRWQRRQLDVRERNLITHARRWGTPWSRLAVALGVRTHQAAQQLYQRLLAWSEPLDEGLVIAGPRSEVAYRREQAGRVSADPDRLVAYPSPRDPAPATVTAVLALLRRLHEHRSALPEDVLPDLAAALDAASPANTLGLVRAVVADLTGLRDALAPDLDALVREAADLLHR